MEKKIFKCFVGSPGDTQAEREACLRVFDEINNGIGNTFRFVVEERMWEHNTRPAFGEYSQAVINEQLGYDYDIFIGILYKKFGTKTHKAESGTEEEFNNAYDRIQKKERVEIMFYFNNAAAKMNEVDSVELNKVNDFKRKIANLGQYYWTYDGHVDFEKSLRKHLTDYFLNLYKSATQPSTKSNVQIEVIRAKFKERLDGALKAFKGQPIVWVDPLISNTNEISHNPDENYSKRFDVQEVIVNPKSTVIKSPPQFGLTSLAHYMVCQAWDRGNLWVYLDSNNIKAHNIHNAVVREAESLGYKIDDVKAIILDSWNSYEIDNLKKIKNLCDAYKNIPIIVMQTIDDSKFLAEATDVEIDREFNTLYLLALPRTQIRSVVAQYNKAKEIGAEDSVLTKVVSDLDVLNIHRTPMNCLTLLKVSEKYFDESPINRTDMVEKILFVLFNTDGIPRYRTTPDLKDCEYVLGRYCEHMVRTATYYFERNDFIKLLKEFCDEKLIDLEVDVVFDVLLANSIITRRDNGFAFRSSFWIYYFAAKRMNDDAAFAKYIFDSKMYISCPEIIEFYTGIDRKKVDALEILKSDLKQTSEEVDSKVRLPEGGMPFSLIRWQPTQQQIQHLQERIGEDVLNSGLPETIKDQYADSNYNQIKPYNQSIQAFFSEYSLHNLIQNIRATARALRNSDYVDPDTKRESLVIILKSWEQITRVLLILTPILAERGRAKFEGQSFFLDGDFGDTYEKRINSITQVNMTNVVGFFKDDIYSSKLAPLLYEHFNNEKDEVKKHQLALLLVFCRPREWKKQIENYIISLNKNSFYLYDIFNALQAKYQYDFASEEDLRELAYLIKMCFAKHEFGSKKPGLHELAKVPLTRRKAD